MRRLLTSFVVAMCPFLVSASELPVRKIPEAYPHLCVVNGAVIGVDYLRRSLPTPLGMQHIPGVLIVEVGVFPEPGRSVTLPSSAFELDWKGTERPEAPADPQIVLAQLLHEEWARGSHYGRLEASAGTVDQNGRHDGVIFGQPRREPRFPGDPTPDTRDQRPEVDPPTPNAPSRGAHPDERPERVIELYALDTTAIEDQTAGLIYFLYRGRLKKLKNLVLRLRAGDSTCSLTIRE